MPPAFGPIGRMARPHPHPTPPHFGGHYGARMKLQTGMVNPSRPRVGFGDAAGLRPPTPMVATRPFPTGGLRLGSHRLTTSQLFQSPHLRTGNYKAPMRGRESGHAGPGDHRGSDPQPARTRARTGAGDPKRGAPQPSLPWPAPPVLRYFPKFTKSLAPVTQNRRFGLDAQKGLRALLEEKGLKITGYEKWFRTGRGGTRGDILIQTRLLESKAKALSRYQKGGQLDVSKLKRVIGRELRGATKYLRDIEGLTNERTGKPLRATVVYTVPPDTPPADLAKVRSVALDTARATRPKIKVGVVRGQPGLTPPGTTVELDPKPGPGGALFGLLAPMAGRQFEAAVGWDLEAREQYGIFRMTRQQKAQVEYIRMLKQNRDFFTKVANILSRQGHRVTPEQLMKTYPGPPAQPSYREPRPGSFIVR